MFMILKIQKGGTCGDVPIAAGERLQMDECLETPKQLAKCVGPYGGSMKLKGIKRTVSEPPKARGPAHFTILLAKGMKGAVDAGVPIKIELGVPSGDGHGTVTVLDEWMRNRAR
jgi:hypothetical protein